MATVSEILDALEARYDIIIEKNSIDDLKKAIERSRAEKAIDKKSKIATARGTSGAGGGGITQSQVKGAIESATNLDAIESSLVSIGSGQITQAQVKTAIESATNLDGVETSLASILSGLLNQADIKGAIESATNIDGVETALADVITAIEGISVGGGGATQAEVKAAIESATNLDGIESSLTSIGSGLITQAQVKAAIESATNIDGVETALADVITAIEGISVGGGGGVTQAEVKAAIESATNLDGLETSLATIANTSFATDTLQATGNATLSSIDTNAIDLNTAIGAKADSSASSDSGAFSLIALAKRLLSKFQIAPQLPDNALSVALPTKLTITGFTSIASTNLDLLDNTGSAAATDVRNYQSGELTVVSTATSGSYIVQSAIDSAFSIGVSTLQLFESTVLNANPINAAITPTNATRKFQLNLQGVNYIRVNLTTATAGIRPILVLSQLGHVPNQFNATIATNQSLSVTNALQLAGSNTLIDIASSVLATSATTAAIAYSWGCSSEFVIFITAFAGTSLDITIEESEDAGVSSWYPIYKFDTITGTGIFRSGRLPQSGNRLRYVQTFVGTSVTRSISRIQSNIPINSAKLTRRSGGVASTADLVLRGKTRRILANNLTGSTIYLQVHDKSSALNTGDVPSGEVYPILANGTISVSASDLGEFGTVLGVNPRLGLSSTFDTYTAVTPLTNTSIFVEST